MKKEWTSYDPKTDIRNGVNEQTLLRKELHGLLIKAPTDPRIVEIRKLLMENRLGRAGLRSLNNQLRGKALDNH